jgi:hypothetical protein
MSTAPVPTTDPMIFVTLDRNPAAAVQTALRPMGRSGGWLRDALDDFEIGRQRLALGFRPEQHGDHD